MTELIAFLGELQAKGVDLYLHQQGLDTGTPAGKAMFQMMGVFAEFERAMIVERVKGALRGRGARVNGSVVDPSPIPLSSVSASSWRPGQES